MNSIIEKRNIIQRDNNTAQEIVESIFSKYSPSVAEITINKSLDGDIDFSFLSEQGFRSLRKLVFSEKGNITSISHLPSSLLTFKCSNQLLTEIELPTNIQSVNISFNYISKIPSDWHKLKQLRIIHAENNVIEVVEKLPERIRELYLSDNKIKYLDLKNCSELVVLHCANNNMLTIQNVPASIVDFKIEHNPVLEVFYGDTPVPLKEASDKEDTNKKYDYVESIHKYFQLEAKYKYNISNDKKLILGKSGIKVGEKIPKSVRQKLNEYIPKCISCQRRVGSIFSLKNDIYSAICGDATHPCGLNIRIHRGGFLLIDDVLNENKKALEVMKDKIIRNKYDMVFQYLDEKKSVDEFRNMYDEYTLWSMHYKKSLDKYNSLYNNVHEEERYNNQLTRVYELKDELNKLRDQYVKDNKHEILVEMMHLYKTQFLPELHQLTTIKYKSCEVNDKHGYHIIEKARGKIKNEPEFLRLKELRIQDIEEPINVEPHVIKFKLR